MSGITACSADGEVARSLRVGLGSNTVEAGFRASAAVGGAAPEVCDRQPSGAGSGAGARSDPNIHTPIQPSTKTTTAPSTSEIQARAFGRCAVDAASLAPYETR